MKIIYIVTITSFFYFINSLADINEFEVSVKKEFENYENCIEEFKKKNRASHEFNLENYLVNYEKEESKNILICNKILEKQIIKPTFKNFLEKQISSNENKNEKIFIKTYLEYHENIMIYSNTSAFVKNSLNEVENYYFKKTDIKTNSLARRVMHDVGWRYKTKINFIDLEKSFFYLSEVVKYETDDYFLKYYLNNLGTIYDSYYGVKSLPISRKKSYDYAYDLYKKAASLGLHYAHDNLAKMHIHGLGSAKKDYNLAIKHLKLARVVSYGDNDFSSLSVLYQKKRNPDDLSEWLFWLEDYLINNQDPDTFMTLAWSIDEDETISVDNLEVIRESYKWFYLCSKFCKSSSDRQRSRSEMHIMQKRFLADKEINQIIINAKNWEKLNWHKEEIKYSIRKEETSKEFSLTDLMRNALLKK